MMTNCESVRESLTAWIDGELPTPDSNRIESHLAACTACKKESHSLRQAVEWQTRVLPVGLLERPVDVTSLQTDLRRKLRQLPSPEENSASVWSWVFKPLTLAVSTAAVALLVVVWSSPEPEPLLVSLGVEPPPAEVETRPDKFQYLDVIEKLDVLEHFEAVQAVRLDDERAELRGVLKG